MQPRMALPAATVLLLLLLQVASAAMSWEPCDRGATAYVPHTVTLTPDPPIIGSPAIFTLLGQTGDAVVGGTVEIDVSFMGLQIFSQTEDLCTKTACPVAAGPINITIIEALPPIAPPGDYGLQVIARDIAGNELVCIAVDFQLVPPSGWNKASGSSKAAASRSGSRSTRSGATVQQRRLLRSAAVGHEQLPTAVL